MQMFLPDAAQPKYTGRLPTTDPTKVFHYEVCFMRVYTNRYPPQMDAPNIAVNGLYAYMPAKPTRPKPAPSFKAV